MLKIYDLRTEYKENPIGIDSTSPRLSWKLESDRRNVMQKSYHILSAIDPDFKVVVYDSGEVLSDESQRIRLAGIKLGSFQTIYWKVSVKAGEDKAESEIAWFETGIMDPKDIKAKWIEPERDFTDYDTTRPAPYLRKEFILGADIRRARICQTSHGLYEFWINGQKGCKDVFKPGFTSYYKRLQYQVYDITTLLREGTNVLAVVLGDGWWRGTTGGLLRNNFGYKLHYLGEIRVEYDDGTIDIIGSDESFKTNSGGLLFSDMMLGDQFDARKEPDGWKLPDFNDTEWDNVHSIDEKLKNLIASRSVPVREKEHFSPKVFKDANGDTVLDFGQNIAGYVRMKMLGLKEGQMVSLTHGEDIKDGSFSLFNLLCMSDRPRFQKIDYIAKGLPEEEYCPMFSIHGFRYVKVEGYDGEINLDTFTAIAVYSDSPEIGDFSCSNPLINQLVSNSRWGQKGNFLDVPTDCPTRERSPWSGDAQTYCRTATRFMNVYPFYEKWLQDLECEQFADGRVPNTFPSTIFFHNKKEFERWSTQEKKDPVQASIIGTMDTPGWSDGSVGWGDVATIVPYTMYLCYGDPQILEVQYKSARLWVDFLFSKAKEMNPANANLPLYTSQDSGDDADFFLDSGFVWGEWLEPDLTPNSADFDLAAFFASLATNPDPEVRMTFLFYSSKLLAFMAKILQKDDDVRKYTDLSNRVKEVFIKYLIKPDGTIKEGRQAPYVRALTFGIYDTRKTKKLLVKKLEDAVEGFNFHMNTGFLATPFLLYALADNGNLESAIKVLEQTTFPSWLFPVTQGATTNLETINALTTHMGSFNHYSFGAVCDFLFGGIAGIRPVIEKPGYKHFQLRPVYGGTITNASAWYDSIYGMIRSSFNVKDNMVIYMFTIPVNTTATVMLPISQINQKKLSNSIRRLRLKMGIYVLTLAAAHSR